MVQEVKETLAFTARNGREWAHRKAPPLYSAAKAFNTSPLIGGNTNIFDVCDLVQYGYGLYADQFGYLESALNFFGPMILPDQL